MKPDILSPEQWAAVMAALATRASSPLKNLCRRMGHGFLRCGNCKQRLGLTSMLVEKYFKEGWPRCCEGTALGGTMGYYLNEKNLERELAIVAAKNGGA